MCFYKIFFQTNRYVLMFNFFWNIAHPQPKMAAVPGKSSVGGGNQPPNKRSKMETGNSSNPALDQDSLYSDQPGSVSSVMRVDTENLKCPVCREYPRMEV